MEDLKKHLRPISLTPCLSKVAEEFVVVDYVKSAVLKVLDPSLCVDTYASSLDGGM